MALNFLKKLFGDTSEKEIKKLEPIINAIEGYAESYAKMSDEELKAKTDFFKSELASGKTLDDILPDAFAVCREAAKRVIGLYPYRVQLIGGVVLHQGRIAEMKTGEGKTLVAVLPSYLNALSGKGVHIVTTNDYLAKRDSEWMGKIHRFLGLSVGVIVHGLTDSERRAAYACDITYATNNELGFDYLRDNLAIYKEDMVQRGHNFAIVDEVDSILIDEARTPLIISGQGDKSTDLYKKADAFAARLKAKVFTSVDEKEEQDDIDADYIVDEKARTATITPKGAKKAEEYFGVDSLSDPANATLLHHINQAIKARGIMKRDIDYVVKDNEIIIVDEFTGRLMYGRRYSEGLHQAIEAKENVKVNRESKTLATITFQNFFRLYSKLSGMTGTAATEEEEFRHIYKLDVIEIPTNKPVIRKDLPDTIYKTENAKFKAVIDRIEECHKRGQPVLVGTISIEKSEILSSMLSKRGVKHNVLNAKQHEKEALIVAQAGQIGAVTIATNMAGRGTDIVLGGNAEYMAKADMAKMGYSEEIIDEATGFAETDNQEIIDARKVFADLLAKHKVQTDKDAEVVKQAGGLCVIGTERHESRRIDNQLRGRSGRQGDPGTSIFYISLEDDLMRLFGGERVMNMMDSLKIDEDMPLDQKILSTALENAQSKVEGRNFQSRKYVLEYDNVLNRQREIIYGQRQNVLNGKDIKDSILTMIGEYVENGVNAFAGEKNYVDILDVPEMLKKFEKLFIAPGEVTFTREYLDSHTKDDIIKMLKEKAFAFYEQKEQRIGSSIMRELERVVLLKTVDSKWMDHIDAMHELRRGVGLAAYAQTDPVLVYKQQGFDMFDQMVAEIREDTARLVLLAEVVGKDAPKREKLMNPITTSGGDGSVSNTPVKKGAKVGRNDPCPCGSGLKYKKCCGK